MGLADTITVHNYPSGMGSSVRWAPMTAGQTFNRGAVVQVTAAGTVTGLPEDDSEVLLADLAEGYTVGLALNGPGTATSAAIPGNYAKIHPDTGTTYATGDRIWFVPFGQHVVFRTATVLAAGGAAAGAAFNGADRNLTGYISYCSTGDPDLGWGLERTAPTAGLITEIWYRIIDVLDARGRSVGATTDGIYATFDVRMGVMI